MDCPVNLLEIEQALKERGWLTLDAAVVTAWIGYTRDLEQRAKPSQSICQTGFVQSGGSGIVGGTTAIPDIHIYHRGK